MKQVLKEIGLLALFALGLCLIGTLAAGICHLLGQDFAGMLWRICAFAGGIILLLAAVFLLSGRLSRKKMKLWDSRFPHIPFYMALVETGVLLILFACIFNYFSF